MIVNLKYLLLVKFLYLPSMYIPFSFYLKALTYFL
jgi:hypothetical protein